MLCPRMCRADRRSKDASGRAYDDKKLGVCGLDETIRISRAALHFWEEPVISGTNGSGAVFFAGCNLGCVYCQNYKISGRAIDESCYSTVSVAGLADIFLSLEGEGAHNINLVTGVMYVPQIIAAIKLARADGLGIPVVYNSSGYELPETIRLLEGYVDMYLPDMKYISSERAKRYSFAPDYPQRAKAAIKEMVRQSGTIVRHMVMPGATKESKAVIKYLYDTYGDDIYISIMSQYTPISERLKGYEEIDRTVTRREYDRVVDYALSIGVKNAYIQDLGVCKESFIPEFKGI